MDHTRSQKKLKLFPLPNLRFHNKFIALVYSAKYTRIKYTRETKYLGKPMFCGANDTLNRNHSISIKNLKVQPKYNPVFLLIKVCHVF